MRILVTGAAGNVGRHLVTQLQEAGHEVRALTRNPKNAGFASGVEAVIGDLSNISTLEGAFRDVDAIHLITFGGGGYNDWKRWFRNVVPRKPTQLEACSLTLRERELAPSFQHEGCVGLIAVVVEGQSDQQVRAGLFSAKETPPKASHSAMADLRPDTTCSIARQDHRCPRNRHR
ncbi:SDR family oxidoreductase [Ensifer sp.]|uniref:SDR family oxidoreductase n=1 Tax=Ensifer sp. TaxID=1872086 RepID=UPI0039181916